MGRGVLESEKKSKRQESFKDWAKDMKRRTSKLTIGKEQLGQIIELMERYHEKKERHLEELERTRERYEALGAG